MHLKNVIRFIICLAIPLTVGGISGFITKDESNSAWFINLAKPSFNPPNAVFAPVWTTLYLLMGVSLYFIYKAPETVIRKKALIVFYSQLFLNFLWSILFFTLHQLMLAVIDIVLLWILLLWMIFLFRQTKPIAGYLQIPYLLWVSFATVLTVSIAYLNT